MVIEIDRKKNAQYRKYTLIIAGLYLLSTVLMLSFTLGMGSDRGSVAVVMGAYLVIMIAFARVFLRAVRFKRTDHHLFVDQTGFAMVEGHARIDIPWGDIETLSLKNWNIDTTDRIHISTYILVKLRPNTPYNKRKHRLYDDYELPLKDVYAQMNQLWTAGQDKGKFIEA